MRRALGIVLVSAGMVPLVIFVGYWTTPWLKLGSGVLLLVFLASFVWRKSVLLSVVAATTAVWLISIAVLNLPRAQRFDVAYVPALLAAFAATLLLAAWLLRPNGMRRNSLRPTSPSDKTATE